MILLISSSAEAFITLLGNNVQQHSKPLLMNNNDVEIKAIPFCGAGAVLIAHPLENSHYMKGATIFIYDCTDNKASGVILDKSTAFVMGEMAPGIEPFESNPLFTGGEDGDDTAIMLHSYDLGGYSRPAGNSGIYVGGMKEAKTLVKNNNNGDDGSSPHPLDFKFLFKSSIWEITDLENEINSNRFKCVSLPIDDILKQNDDYSLYNKIKNILIDRNEWFNDD